MTLCHFVFSNLGRTVQFFSTISLCALTADFRHASEPARGIASVSSIGCSHTVLVDSASQDFFSSASRMPCAIAFATMRGCTILVITMTTAIGPPTPMTVHKVSLFVLTRTRACITLRSVMAKNTRVHALSDAGIVASKRRLRSGSASLARNVSESMRSNAKALVHENRGPNATEIPLMIHTAPLVKTLL